MRCFQRLFPLGGGVLLLALATLTLTSCGSFDATSDFASKAQRAIGKGVPILSDLTGSCIRRHLADTPFSEFESSADAPQAGCSAFADREQGIIATAKVLSDYFSALSQLASAGTVSTGEHASSAASSAVRLRSRSVMTSQRPCITCSLRTGPRCRSRDLSRAGKEPVQAAASRSCALFRRTFAG